MLISIRINGARMFFERGPRAWRLYEGTDMEQCGACAAQLAENYQVINAASGFGVRCGACGAHYPAKIDTQPKAKS